MACLALLGLLTLASHLWSWFPSYFHRADPPPTDLESHGFSRPYRFFLGVVAAGFLSFLFIIIIFKSSPKDMFIDF